MNELITKDEEVKLPTIKRSVGFMDFSNLDNAMRCAEMICSSGLTPGAYKDQPAKALVAIQMGLELGFKPLQSLQNIDVIQGKPSLKTEAMLALCQGSSEFEYCSEEFEGEGDDLTAVFKVKRKGHAEHERRFSIVEAKRAGLFGKTGPWQQYPRRMLQMRARSWGLKDKFADIIYGLYTPEEVAEFTPIEEPVQKFEHIGDKIKAQLKQKTGEVIEHEVVMKDISLVPILNEGESVNQDTGEITPDPLDRLLNLVDQMQITTEQIQKWLNKAGVDSMDLLTTDQIMKLIAKLEKDKAKE